MDEQYWHDSRFLYVILTNIMQQYNSHDKRLLCCANVRHITPHVTVATPAETKWFQPIYSASAVTTLF
jgi:hypothetical protein